jgi:hypothetical protein
MPETMTPPAPNIVTEPSPGPRASVPPIPAQVASGSVAPPIEPSAPPKPGSAKSKMFSALRNKGKDGPTGFNTPEPKETPKVPEEAPKQPQDAPELSKETKSPETTTEPAEPSTEPVRDESKKPDKNFWRTFDSWKKRATDAEAQIAELRKSVIPEQDRKTIEEREQKALARAKELEEHIAFVDFSKSEKFQTEYQQPYEKAWDRAMSEVGQLSVTDATTEQVRPATAQDMAAIVNLPLGEARTLANQMFGEFAGDVMSYRKEIRDLFERQNAALTDAKKNAVAHQQHVAEMQKKAVQELSNSISKTFQEVNEALVKDPKIAPIFQPQEGDSEGNSRLEKGYALVDKAWSEDPRNPKLTAAERSEIIKRHAAVRHRAAAFGKLLNQFNKSQEQIAAMRKELEGYKTSAPRTSGSQTASTAASQTEGNSMNGLKARLRSLARPGL